MALFNVRLQGIEMNDLLLKVTRSWDLGGLLVQTSGDEDVDLLYHLTKKNSGFEKLIRRHPDGKYRILVEKESLASRLRRKHGNNRFKKYPPTFAWHGWSLVTKQKDQIFIDTRWFQVGDMNKYNLDIEPRDVQAEVKRTNWRNVPSGGLPRPQVWEKEKEERVSERIKDRLVKYY